MARLAVPYIADYCFIDIFEDELLRRITVVSPYLPVEIWHQEVEGLLLDVVKHVLKSRRAAVYPAIAGPPEPALDVDDLHPSIQSYMSVPLRINERVLGTLTLVSAHAGHRYTFNDLVLLEDLARRAVVAFENAHVYADALHAIQSRDDVLSTVSHDLKSPLAIVTGFVQIFLKGASADDKQITCDRKQVEAIRRAGRRMNALIDDLLDTARIEAKNLYVVREDCTISTLINDAMELPHSLATSKGVQLTSDIPADLPSLLVDRHRISQVFANLIGNAIKFTPAAGTITVRAELRDDDVQFCIEDTGPGISKEEIPHLFDRFWQAKKTAGLGTGLGLFIVKGIVEGHSGRIWVESDPGKGSRFIFTLPLPQVFESRQ